MVYIFCNCNNLNNKKLKDHCISKSLFKKVGAGKIGEKEERRRGRGGGGEGEGEEEE